MPQHGVSPRNGDATPHGPSGPAGKFGRLFPELSPLTLCKPRSLIRLSRAMSEAAEGAVTGDHPDLPAGYLYLGQFIDHDVTFDPTTLSETRVDPLALHNFRTPALDLDALYGAGPAVQPFLYQRKNPALLQFGTTSLRPATNDPGARTALPFDLPRAPHGFALIADPRNDENLIVAQLHLAFIYFHNKVVRDLESGAIPRRSPVRKTLFEEARDLVTWHYQWIVLEDFLPKIVDPGEVARVRAEGSMLSRLCAACGWDPFIPVEFSAAAYRFGHSMINSKYEYNRVFNHATGRPATLKDLFDLSGRRGGNVPIPSDWIIDWRRFFKIDPGMAPNNTRLIDPYLATELRSLFMGPQAKPLDLARQNLLRGNSLGLPAGQSVARLLKCPRLCPDEIAASLPDGKVAAEHGLHVESPLWYYILKEAQLRGHGLRLGPLGSRLVAEVLVGLIQSDRTSFLHRQPEWQPTLGAKSGEFGMADLVRVVIDEETRLKELFS
jgi:hypothetical protein